MKNAPYLILCVSMHLLWTGLGAQQASYNPNQYAPSPKALEMIRSGLLPADLNSGSISYEIPLYTIADRDFSVPIVLRYATQGFQPARQSGDAGLHWTLMAGGMITREIVGVDDFGEYGFHGGTSASGDQALYQMTLPLTYQAHNTPEASGNGRETCSDIYHFSFPGHSGSFVINHDGQSFSAFGTSGGRGTYTITFSSESKSFTIKTGDGYQYRFGYDPNPSTEHTKEMRWYRSAKQSGEQGNDFEDGQVAIVTWLLDRIVAPNGRTVDFVYVSSRANKDIPQSGDDVLTTFYRKNPTVLDINTGQTDGSYKGASLTYTSYLKRIAVDSVFNQTPTLGISFSWYRPADKELSGSPPDSYAGLVQPKRRLSQVSVFDNGTLVRHTTLGYTQSGTRPLLTSVVTDGFGSYAMSYYTDLTHPLPGILSNALDFWGYYNGKDSTSDSSISPVAVNDNLDEYVTHDFMNPDWNYSRLGLLSQITYPTGGSTGITYEANTATKILLRSHASGGFQPSNPELTEDIYAFLPTLHLTAGTLPSGQCGGVRVASLTDDDGIGNPSVRTFSYDKTGGGSSGIVQQFPRFFAGKIGNTAVFNPALKFPGASFDQLPVAYSRVTEHFADSSFVVTTFSDWESDPDEYSAYRQRHGFLCIESDSLFLNNILREPDSRAYRRGRPLLRRSYRNDSTMVREESWTYGDYGSGYSAYVVGSGDYWWSARRFLCDRLPSRLDVIEYPDDGGASHQEFVIYGYDSNNLPNLERHGTALMTEEVRTVYSGNTSLSGPVYSQMLSDGVVSLPVEREVWRGSQPVSGTRMEYTRLGAGHYVPFTQRRASVSPGTGSLTYGIPETTFDSYDAYGNPLVILSRDGIPSTLTWKDDGLYPTALFRGARNGLQTLTQHIQQTRTETQSYNEVTSVTKTFTSDVTGMFTLSFDNQKTDGSGIKATLDGTQLNLMEIIDFGTGIPLSYTAMRSNLPAGSHTLVLTGKKPPLQPSDPLGDTSDPEGMKSGITIKGSLTINYKIVSEQTQTVNETDVLYEDFDTDGTAGAGFGGSGGRTTGYTQSLTVRPGRTYVVDGLQKVGDSWEYRRDTLSSATGSLALSITASSVSPVDNVRFYPYGVDATSWTWKGNIGMGSVTDGRGIVERYVYDIYGRLTGRLDNDGNQVEGWQYHFAPLSPGDSYISNILYTSTSGLTQNQTTAFYDGLGKPFQTVRKSASPVSMNTTADLVEWTEYDLKGRPSRQWLPASVTVGAGHIPSSSFLTGSQATYGSAEEAWSGTSYDGTPLERVRKTVGPGMAWHDAGKGITTDYLTNRNSGPLACRKHSISLSGNTGLTIQNDGFYPAGELTVVRTTDEDGRVIEVFTDALGQKRLERRLVSGSATSSSSVWADTYFLYDTLGRNVAVLPPLLSEAVGQDGWSSGSTTSQSMQSAMAYQYRYDDRNRMIAKKLPGAEWIYYVYDKGDRLVLTQDGNRRAEGEWVFRAEDLLGRECLSGILTGTFNSFADPLASKSVIASRTGDYSTLHGYWVSDLGVGGATLLGVNWWDDHGFIGEDAAVPALKCGYDTTVEGDGFGSRYLPSSQGLLTGSLAGVIGNAGINGYLWRSLYYDAKGRVVQEHRADTDSGRYSRTFSGYDFPGNLTKYRYDHYKQDTLVTRETYTYGYDGWGRPTATQHRLGSGTWVTLSEKSYDRAGRLAAESRNGSVAGLQTTYSYNVRSWLTDLSAGASGNTFRQKLYYNEPRDGSTADAYQWGGNIARMDWKAGGGGEDRVYQFGYDLLSRLTEATCTGPSTFRDNFTRSYSYDLNGNVTGRGAKTMDNGWQLVTTPYTYAGNHLSSGTYDANGNMTAGLGYTTSFNVLNLPDSVVLEGNSVGYSYTAEGVKIGRTSTDGISSDCTVYAGNLIYRNGLPESLLVEGGFIDLTGSSPAYRFYVTDHQGNIRVVTDASGTVLRTNHYDPYGEEVIPVLTSASTLPASTAGTDAASRFMYGAKEWDREISLYDFSARYYSPAGPVSFTTMDPLCEKYYAISPYAYCAGNPVNIVDPNGMADFWINGRLIGNDGVDDQRILVIRTEQLTKKEIKETKRFILINSGDKEAFINNGIAYNNSIEIESSAENRKAMITEIMKDNGKGGTSDSNNREYGGSIQNGKVVLAEPGAISNPKTNAIASITLPMGFSTFHSHPSGIVVESPSSNTIGGITTTYSFIQEPSSDDRNNAGTNTHYVFGRSSGNVYVYTFEGIQAIIPMKYFVTPKIR